MSSKATSNQKDALQKMGIIPPPTRASCTKLLKWLIGNSGPDGERIAIVVAAQKRFHEKRVKHMDGRQGKAQYVYYRSLEVRLPPTRAEHQYTHPLDAMIAWDDGHTSATSLGSLIPLEEEVEA